MFDNLGIRAFSWLKHQGKQFDEVIVSDAGKPFQILSDSSLGFIGQSVRATDILWDRVWQLERENFGKQDGFVFVPITGIVEATEQPSLHPVIQGEVQSIRTDLDRFSDVEVNALAQHGYEVARKVYREHHPGEELPPPANLPWAPIAKKRLPGVDSKPVSSNEACPAVAVSRQLRNSSVRRVWSTLLAFRDWPSYVYLALALFLFVYLPLQVYQLYDRAQILTKVNHAIAQGDPDIRRVLNLVAEDPTKGWVAETVEEVPERTIADYSGIELMTHSRIMDLRRWRPVETDKLRRGKIYVSDRIELKLLNTYSGDRQVTLAFPTDVEDIEFRQAPSGHRATIRKVAEATEVFGQKQTLYEFQFNLAAVSVGEPVTLGIEMLADLPQDRTRTQFTTRLATDLFSMWMLFPDDRPYRTYSLVQYPADRSDAPAVLDSRYRIDHPYGSLIGWSLVNPKVGNVYECRWTYE